MSSEIRAARATARALGWFSLGLGIAEVLWAHRIARLAGMSGHDASVRARGLREIVTGAAILVADRPAPLIWTRVAGDAVDLALLGARAFPDQRRSSDAAVAMLAVAGVTAVDVACARALGSAREAGPDLRHYYASRSGFPKPPALMQGAARTDFEAPADMRTPAALRPYGAV